MDSEDAERKEQSPPQPWVGGAWPSGNIDRHRLRVLRILPASSM
jgi:hypothetical protein